MNNGKIRLKQGYVICPSNTKVYVDSDGLRPNYATVLTEKNRLLPPKLILLIKPLEEYSDREIEALLDWIELLDPVVKELRQRSLALANKSVQSITEDEWNATPCLGFFPVPEVTDIKDGIAGFGIIRGGIE